MTTPTIGRRAFALGLGAAALGVAAARAEMPVAKPGERAIGRADAPVTVIEYHSLTCGNCAGFHQQIFPQIRQAFIDTGLVRFVLRDFPLDGVAVEAATLAHCAGPERYAEVVGMLYRDKERWAHAKEPLVYLRQMAPFLGVPVERFDACRSDKAFVGEILRMAFEGQQQYQIRGTPSFVIGGKLYGGVLPFDRFAEIVRPLLPAIAVSDGWTRATPTSRSGAGYLTLRNTGDAADRLLAAESPAARTVELHTMTMEEGVMRMRPAAPPAIAAGGELRLAPGGLHLMLMDLAEPLAVGATVPLTLRFERAGAVAASLSVQPIGARGPEGTAGR